MAIAGLVLAGGALALVKWHQISTMVRTGEEQVPPPEAVTTATVTAEVWRASRSAVGSVLAERGVTIAAEVPGTVRSIHFESGQGVRKNQVLLRLDVTEERAQVASARAEVELARASLARANALARSGSGTKAQLDEAVAREASANARARALEAIIQKKVIRAPFAGTAGIRRIDLGQVLAPGDPIVSLAALQALFVDFSLPQSAVGAFGVGAEVSITTGVFPGREWRGRVTALDPVLDRSTRMLRARARFDNTEALLRPGMFAAVTVLLPEVREVLLIPATSVVSAPHGDSVFLVKPAQGEQAEPGGLVAQHRFVRLGERRGDLVEVTFGLRAGELVVSTGAFKLQNHARVMVDNRLAPELSESPSPPES